MKIAILTMFNGFSTTYSLVNVVAEQIKMILKYSDYEVTLFVSETCDMSERFGIYLNEKLKIETIANKINGMQMHWIDYDLTNTLDKNFFKEVEIIEKDMVEKLKDYNICIMHDILYQGVHLIHNVAIRKAQKKLANLHFVSFTHSMPLEYEKLEYPFNQRFCDMPNTIFVYPTASGLKALSEQYQVDMNRCQLVYNTIPITENMHQTVKELEYKTDFLNNDILVVYPARLTQAKKFEKVAMLCGSIAKANNITVKVIFCDFPSVDIDCTKYKKWVKTKGKEFGLKKDNIIFTSDYGYKGGIHRNAVLDLFKLSTIFICPSFAESFSLTVLEASLNGNFLVLNESQPALKELGENLGAYFMKWDAKNFGFETKEEYLPKEEDYYLDNAKEIYFRILSNSTLSAKKVILKKFSSRYIWNNQLKLIIVNKILD